MLKIQASRLWLLLMVAVVCTTVLFGCKGANPVSVAETPEQKAFALYGVYVVFAEEALTLAQTPSVPASIRLGLVNAEAVAKPSADALKAAYDEAVMIAREVATGATPEEKYVIAITNLNKWVTDSAPVITALQTAVQGARN